MKNKSTYNKIKYGLLDLFPKEHPYFYIDNETKSITYHKILEDGNSLYGEIEQLSDGSMFFWILRTRTTYTDIPVYDRTWDNLWKFLGDKDMDNEISGLSGEENTDVDVNADDNER